MRACLPKLRIGLSKLDAANEEWHIPIQRPDPAHPKAGVGGEENLEIYEAAKAYEEVLISFLHLVE